MPASGGVLLLGFSLPFGIGHHIGHFALEARMDEPWLKPDLLFLRSALAQGVSYAEVAGFLCRDKDEVRKKAKELNLKERVVLRPVRQQIEEAQSAIQKTGTEAALEGCRLLLARINAALSGTQPAHFYMILNVKDRDFLTQ